MFPSLTISLQGLISLFLYLLLFTFVPFSGFVSMGFTCADSNLSNTNVRVTLSVLVPKLSSTVNYKLYSISTSESKAGTVVVVMLINLLSCKHFSLNCLLCLWVIKSVITVETYCL